MEINDGAPPQPMNKPFNLENMARGEFPILAQFPPEHLSEIMRSVARTKEIEMRTKDNQIKVQVLNAQRLLTETENAGQVDILRSETEKELAIIHARKGNYVDKTHAETEKTRAETEKIKAETEKTRAETERLRSNAAAVAPVAPPPPSAAPVAPPSAAPVAPPRNPNKKKKRGVDTDSDFELSQSEDSGSPARKTMTLRSSKRATLVDSSTCPPDFKDFVTVSRVIKYTYGTELDTLTKAGLEKALVQADLLLKKHPALNDYDSQQGVSLREDLTPFSKERVYRDYDFITVQNVIKQTFSKILKKP
jgi:hypothetical protein